MEAQVYTPLANREGAPSSSETAVASTEVTVELSVVIPVHNKERSIASVVEEWTAELHRLVLRPEIRRYDHGSTNDSAEILRRLQDSRGSTRSQH